MNKRMPGDSAMNCRMYCNTTAPFASYGHDIACPYEANEIYLFPVSRSIARLTLRAYNRCGEFVGGTH